MTNQDVINFLNQIRKILLDDKSWLESTIQQINEAFDMAISALQAQECSRHKCRDTVSRQEAIEAVMDLCKHYTPTKSVNHPHMDFVIEVLQDLPSAQPEIIRCKDCKWWSNDDYRECSSPNYDDGYVTPAGFYCGYAERRTDERTD